MSAPAPDEPEAVRAEADEPEAVRADAARVDAVRADAVRSLAERYFEVVVFLNDEAALLDAQRFEDWLALFDDELRYVMPIRVTTLGGEAAGGDASDAGDAGGGAGLCHFDDDRFSLTKRVRRLSGDHAWTESPPSRTRRFVTNVRLLSDDGAQLECASYLLLFRSRLDDREPEWLSVERHDLLVRRGNELRIRWRKATVDESVLRTQNLAAFV